MYAERKENLKNLKKLADKKIFILDLDGTFYLGNRLIDGSLDFIGKLKKTGKEFLFFTNNSSRTAEDYIKKLSGMGLEITRNQIATSADVTINYLKKYYTDKSIYLLATPIVEKQFRDSGIKINSNSADAVVVTFDKSLTYDKLYLACSLIRNGSSFIATHPDINCPTEDGFEPDCGSMCALITASTGVKPKYLGKPYRETVDFIVERTGYNLDEIIFVGDRLYTDIATGYNHGASSLLVLSGETSMTDLEKSSIKPDYVFQDLGKAADAL